MFDQSPEVNSRSTRSLILSAAVHGAVVIGIFAARFTVETKLATRRASVTLLAPMAVRPAKPAAVRAPFRPTEVHAVVKLPPLRLPALTPPIIEPMPVLKASPVPVVVA